MSFSNRFLQKCDRLKEAGYEPALRAGMIVARGFADVGSEPFCILPDGRLVSLLCGEVSDFSEEHRSFFCHVPHSDELVQALRERGFDINVCDYLDHREWRVTLQDADTSGESRFTAATLQEALLDALLFACLEREG